MLKSIAQTAGSANLIEWTKLELKDLKAPVMRVTRSRHEHGYILLEEVVLALSHFPGLAADGEVIPDIIELAQRFGLSVGPLSNTLLSSRPLMLSRSIWALQREPA